MVPIESTQPVRIPHRTPAAVMSLKFFCSSTIAPYQQPSSSSKRRNPECPSGFPPGARTNRSGKAGSRQQSQPNSFGRIPIFSPRDQPQTNRRQEKSDHRNSPRQSLREHAKNSWNRRTQHCGHGRGQSHSSRGKRAIENCQSATTTSPARQHPQHAPSRRKLRMSRRGQRPHQNQSPEVHHGGKQKRIGPARGVAAEKSLVPHAKIAAIP